MPSDQQKMKQPTKILKNNDVQYFEYGVPFTILEIGDIIFSENYERLKYVSFIDHSTMIIKFKTIFGYNDDQQNHHILNKDEPNEYPLITHLQKVKKYQQLK